MTAVYGGSKTVIDPVVLPYMFGTTYPIFDAQGIVSEYVRNPDLAEYVRWEYRPADRSSVMRSIKRRRTTTRRIRFAVAARIARRLRAWAKDLRETTGGRSDRVSSIARSCARRSSRLVGRVDREHDLPELLASPQVFVGLAGLLEREDSVYDRLEAAHEHELHDLLEFPPVRHRRTEHGELPPEEVSRIELEQRAGRRARDHDAAPFPEAPHGVLERRLADMIDDDIDAALPREFPNRLGPRDRLVVDEDIRAERLRLLQLRVARARREDRAAGELCDLDRGGRDAGSGAEDENVLSRPDLRAGDEHPPRGHERQRDGGGLREVHVRRDREDVSRGDGDLFSVGPGKVFTEDLVVHAFGVLPPEAVLATAARDPRFHDDTVADLDVGHIGADLRDVARRTAAEDARARRLQGRDSFADRQVEMVQGRRVDADDNLVRPRDGIRMVRIQLENLRPAEAGHDDRLQRTTCATAANRSGPR